MDKKVVSSIANMIMNKRKQKESDKNKRIPDGDRIEILEKCNIIKNMIYQPIQTYVDEINQTIEDDDSMSTEGAKLTAINQNNRYMDFQLRMTDELTLNFKFEILDSSIYNLKKYEEINAIKPFENISDKDVYPRYYNQDILCWGMVTLNQTYIGYNIIAVSGGEGTSLFLLRKDPYIQKQGDFTPKCLISFEELYKESMLNGWKRTTKINTDPNDIDNVCETILLLSKFEMFCRTPDSLT